MFDFFSSRCFLFGPGHVLIAAHDERTCSQLREVCNLKHILPTLYDTFIREVMQIATAGATTAVVTEKVWGEYVSVVCQILAKRNTKMSET